MRRKGFTLRELPEISLWKGSRSVLIRDIVLYETVRSTTDVHNV